MTDSCEVRSTYEFMSALAAVWERTADTVEINRLVENHLNDVVDFDDCRVVRGFRCGRMYFAVVEMCDIDEGYVEEPYTLEVPEAPWSGQ